MVFEDSNVENPQKDGQEEGFLPNQVNILS